MTEPLVGVIMGSRSDWETMQHAAATLESLGVPFETRVLSAHRTPDQLAEYAATAAGRGLEVVIAAAGGAAALPGAVAAKTALPVLGVPMESKSLNGLDSLLSMVQMPAGVPVGTLAIGKAGAVNAALLAAGILALSNPEVRARLLAYRERQTADVLDRIPGVTIVLEGGSWGFRVPKLTRQMGCEPGPRVYLDGLIMNSGGTPFDVNTIQVEDILAVEVFRHVAEVPLKYGGTEAVCGVLLFWTKH